VKVEDAMILQAGLRGASERQEFMGDAAKDQAAK
jgi:hypothetical protein